MLTTHNLLIHLRSLVSLYSYCVLVWNDTFRRENVMSWLRITPQLGQIARWRYHVAGSFHYNNFFSLACWFSIVASLNIQFSWSAGGLAFGWAICSSVARTRALDRKYCFRHSWVCLPMGRRMWFASFFFRSPRCAEIRIGRRKSGGGMGERRDRISLPTRP